MARELKDIVRSYALDIEAAADGELYEVDGEPTIIDDLEEWKRGVWERKRDAFILEYERNHGTRELDFDHEEYATEEEYLESEIGSVDDIDDPGQISVAEYIGDQSLGDIRFEVNGRKECLGGKVLLAFGGPNVWLSDDEIRGYWGCDMETWTLDPEARTALSDFFEEEWDAIC